MILFDGPEAPQSIAEGRGCTEDFREAVAEFFDLFDHGSNLRTLEIHVFDNGFTADIVEEALSELRGLKVRGNSSITRWAGEDGVEVSEERKKMVADALSKSKGGD